MLLLLIVTLAQPLTSATPGVAWNKTYGGPGDDEGYSVIAVSDGFVITGRTGFFPKTDYNVILVKFNLDAGSPVTTGVPTGVPTAIKSGTSTPAPSKSGGEFVLSTVVAVMAGCIFLSGRRGRQ